MTTRFMHSKRLALIFISSILIIFACSRSTPQLSRLAPDAVVLAFGDSLTYGTGADSAHSYPYILQELIGREISNAGVPGELSADGLKRLPDLLNKIQPSLVLICHGGNDLLQRRSAKSMLENVRQMVITAQKSGAAVILIGVPTPTILLSAHAGYARIADELKIPYEGDIISDVLSDASLKADPAHPNAIGYKKVAEAIAAMLRKSGALP